MKSIPASDIVQILPGVVGTGGNPLALNALFITKKQPASMLGVKAFGSADLVGEVFGKDSKEYEAAQVYFAGFDNCTVLPDTLFIASMVTTAQAAKLVGAKLPTRTASEFAALPQGLILTIDGQVTSVNFETEVNSYSSLAAAVTTALGAAATCTYDTGAKVFVIEGATKGAVGSISFAEGDLATFMGLTEASGAQANNGINADTIEELLPRITKETTNFVSIAAIDFTAEEKLAISRWVALQKDRYMHVLYQTENGEGELETISSAIKESDIGGTCLFYGSHKHAAFVCGFAASLNFDELNGRTNLAFRGQEGLTPSVTDKALADELIAMGFNFYGAYGTANDRFIFVYPGSVSGKFKWVDSYVNQVFFNNQLQLALMTMLKSFKSVPYNETGKAIHRSAVADPVFQMLNFGGIQTGVALSEQQKKQINIEAGFDAASQINTAGWCMKIEDTPAQTRGLRKSMPLKLWYADGGSVQQVNLPSINVQ
ncbi:MULTISPECIES: DUF3383 domain-containing protein [Providencia]|uniref:DUF3383 domain-containing protein n=1 Tax=Providencia TaxID=586 RepID=UPI000D3B8383|nr:MULTISPECIES: DUF3383 domain-containing protein [Providencia]